MFYGRFVEPVEIGAGSFGTVYQALDPKEGHYVALKECACGKSSNAAVHIEKMKAEYNLIKRLEHENIVPVYDLITSNDGYVVVSMELASGGSLREMLRRVRFRLYESTVRGYFYGALKGLAYLHRQEVLHCDIKPENMVLCGKTVKLCDFGLSKQLAPSSTGGHKTMNISGTPRYMAPEMWDTNTYTRATDIWALGCTVVELGTGKLPWETEVPADRHDFAVIFFVHGLQKPDSKYDPDAVVPKHFSKPLRDLLKRCLSVDPTLRPSAQELLASPYFRTEDWRASEAEAEAEYDDAMTRVHSSPDSASNRAEPSFEIDDDGCDGDGGSSSPTVVVDDVVVLRSDEKVLSRSAAPSPAATSASSTAAPCKHQSTEHQGTLASRRSAVPQRTESADITDSKKCLAKSAKRPVPPVSKLSNKVADAIQPVSASVGTSSPPLSKVATVPKKKRSLEVLWVFQNGAQKCPYSADLQGPIEAAYQESKRSILVTTQRLLDKQPAQYEIDFEKMRQCNVATGYMRKIERLECAMH